MKRFFWMDFVPATLATIFFISQIIIGIYLVSSVSQIDFLAYAGVGLYAFAGLFREMSPLVVGSKSQR